MPESPGSSSAAEELRPNTSITRSRVLIALFKGVLYREAGNAGLFQDLLDQENAVRDYVGMLGLQLSVDEAEGFAYLRSQEFLDGEVALPRLVARRPLSFGVSLVLALLRKRLLETESSGASRLIMSRNDILDMVRVYLPTRTNEALVMDQVQRTAINRIEELGFMRKLPSGEDFEVMHVIKAFVDAEWLSDFNEKLAAYLEGREGGSARGKEGIDG